MKKLHIFWAALAAVVVAACATVEKEEEPEVVVPEGFKVLSIEATRVDDTKTAYAGDVTFSWSAGDQISVLCNDGSRNFWQTFTVDTPSASSTFTATVSGSTNVGALDGTKVALYPADEDHAYTSAGAISFHIPAERDFRTASGGHKETAIPMFAWGDADNTFAFANLTGAVKFTFSNIPAATTQVKMEFTNTCHLKLNGTYPLLHLDQGAAVVEWEAASSQKSDENTVSYYADVENGLASFYLPYAAGSLWAYNELKLSDANDSNASPLYNNEQVGQINVTKNKIVVLPTLDVTTGAVEAGLTSAYGINWSTIEASRNTNSQYPAIKTMKATADEGYLYVYLEVDPAQLTKTHEYDHYIKVYAAGATGSNSWWSNQNSVTKIGNSAWAVANGSIAYADFGQNPSDCNKLAGTSTWYYELKMSRANNAAITDPGTVNIGVILDDTFYQAGYGSNGYGHTQGDVPCGIIPTASSAMYPVTLPGSTPFSYTSAYNLDWSGVEVSENTSTTYEAIKSLRAQTDDSYLYLLMEVDPTKVSTNHNFAHYFQLYYEDASGSAEYWGSTPVFQFGEDSWGVVNGAAAFEDFDSGEYSNCSTQIVGSSWFYEVKISRSHSSCEVALGGAGTVNIGVVMDDQYVDGDYPNETWGNVNGGTPVGVIPSGASLYPVSFTTAITPPVNNVNISETFTESSANISNPERGFYKFVEYKYKDPNHNNQAYPAATYSLTDSYDSENTLVLALFYLFDYVEGGTISNDALTYIRNVFTNIRSSGKKAIVRFGYSNEHVEDKTVDPRTIHQEPTKEKILAHIAQVKPILQEFEVVILVGQAGFIGTYGEWYYTTYFSNFSKSGGKWTETRDWTYNENTDQVTGFDNRHTILEAILDAFPSSRQVEVRTPAYKQYYISPNNVSSWTTLTDSNGFGTDPVNRLAFHNDAFLYGGSDLGTFHYDFEKAMWQQQAEYLICGGEAPYSSTDISEMDGYTWNKVPAGVYNNHYTYLHHDTAYPSGNSGGSTLFRYWYQQGWIPAIKKMLGYRLYLTNATITGADLNSGTTLNVSLTLNNSGAARVINQRPMELVLIHNDTATVLNSDIGNVRLVPSGTVSGSTVTPGSKTYTFTVTLPQNIVSGDKLALWLPDNATGLQSRAEYSIRLANNETTWTSGGYNVFYTF